jgi:hypothetical protein
VASNPGPDHKKEIETCLVGYLACTVEDHCIKFSRESVYTGERENDPALHSDGRIKDSANVGHFGLELFVDANFVDDARDDSIDVKHKDMRSRGGTCIKGVGGPLLVSSKKHTLKLSSEKQAKKHVSCSDNDCIELDMLALHTQESEHVQMSSGIKDVKGIVNLFIELGFGTKGVKIPMFEDNSACARLATDQINRSNGKHIHLCCSHIQMAIRSGLFEVCLIKDPEQVADILTKALSEKKFTYHSTYMRGVVIFKMKPKCKFIG